MGIGVISSIMFAAPLLTLFKDREPKIKAHTARVLARRAAIKSGDVAPRAERQRAANATASDEAPAMASTGGSAPRPGSRPTGTKRNSGTNRGGRPGGTGNRPGGGAKRR